MYQAIASSTFGPKEYRSRHMWAFDSFAGLPASEDPRDAHQYWRPGTYRTTKETFLDACAKAGISSSQFSIIEGFYNESLKNLTSDQQTALTEIAIAYIDCDLYTSTCDVLRFLAPRLKNGMLLCFDDYYCMSPRGPSGERLAFMEFEQSHLQKFRFVEYFRYHWAGASFLVEVR